MTKKTGVIILVVLLVVILILGFSVPWKKIFKGKGGGGNGTPIPPDGTLEGESQFLLYTPLPGDINDAQLKFTAENFAVALSRGYTNTAKLKSYNPDIEFFYYKNLIGTNDLQKDWEIIDSHEEWFTHSSASISKSNRIKLTSFNFWVMDISNSAYISQWISSAKEELDKRAYDGIFTDDANEILPVGKVPEQPYDYTDNSWSDSVNNMLSEIKQELPNKLVVFNGLYKAHQDPYTGIKNLDVADGGVDEGFVQRTRTGEMISESEWKDKIELILSNPKPTKYKLLQCRADVGNIPLEERMFCFTSFLLVKDDNTVFSFVDKKYFMGKNDPERVQYYPEYTIELGTPLETFTSLDSYLKNGVYERNFENGKVLVNPGSSSKTITLDKTYRLVNPIGGGPITSDGKPTGSLEYENVNSVTISGQSGVVLLSS